MKNASNVSICIQLFKMAGWRERWWGERERQLLICASQQRSKSLEVSGTDRKRVKEPPIHLATIQEHPSALSHNTWSALIILIIHCQKRENSLMQLSATAIATLFYNPEVKQRKVLFYT